MDVKSLQKRLLSWFKKNKRKLPWREVPDWYRIWISEVMLQQTQVDQVVPYFLRFTKKFTNVNQLAMAPEEQVLKVWEGLGYYSRARNLHRSAKIIVEKYQSELPRDREKLSQLPGFGPYTTNAVLSLAFNQPYAVVDGNIKRVIARLYALPDDIRNPATHKLIQNHMDSLLPERQSAFFNEAMMELGALVCQPVNPNCSQCPVRVNCSAQHQGITDQLPFRSQKSKIPIRQSITYIIRHRGNYLLCKRKPTEMLGGMWEFPISQIQLTETDNMIEKSEFYKRTTGEVTVKKSWPAVKHSYTHFRLILHPVLLFANKAELPIEGYEAYAWRSLAALKKLPLHKAMWKVLEQIENDLIVITD